MLKPPPKLVFSIVGEKSELVSALEMVSRVYKREGFISTNGILPLWMENLHSPTTKTIVARAGEVIVGSVSIFHDDPTHPLMDDSYPKTREYRKEDKKIADVGRLAVDVDLLAKLQIPNSSVSMPLIAHVLRYGIESELDLYVIEVSKEHAPIYAALGFKPDGEPRWCTFRGTSPKRFLYPLALDLNWCRKNKAELKNFIWRTAFGNTIQLV